MIMFVLAYLGGVLTILSPCILPVLPFVFARADKPFVKSGLPLLVGLALTFALVATLASVAGGWAVQANAIGRDLALALLALFGVTLLLPSLADRLTRPLVAFGGRLSSNSDGGVVSSLLLGVATGFLWAPCAGPILGLILTGAALKGANASTTVLLLAYALGAATSLAIALLAGGKVFAAMKKSLGAGEWVRRGLGVLVLVAVAAIAFGVDTGFLTQVSTASTTSIEQGLLDKLRMGQSVKTPSVIMGQDGSGAAMKGAPSMTGPAMTGGGKAGAGLPVLGAMPPLDGATLWLNTPPLTREQLKGKVVLVDFWTYSCINCLRALPYVEAWAKRYSAQGLVVIGVHTPEFAFEKQVPNVKKAVHDLGVTYPVAMDNDYAIWKAFNNDSWPAHYFIDAQGRIRSEHDGEGDYDKSEQTIRALLAERNGAPVTGDLVGKAGSGVQAAADFDDAYSPETYLGFNRAMNFMSPGGQQNDRSADYTAPSKLKPDGWALIGRWIMTKEYAGLQKPGGAVVFSFHARDLHMVLGPSPDGKPIRFRVSIDGKPLGDDHGVDVDAAGNGVVTSQRLYQLIRQHTVAKDDRTFQIQFLDAGVQAFTFTFG